MVAQIEEQFAEVGEGGLKKSILVMIVMSQLREVNEFWNRCDLDINGVPNEEEQHWNEKTKTESSIFNL